MQFLLPENQLAFQVDRRPIINSPGEFNLKKRPDFLSTRYLLVLLNDYTACSGLCFELSFIVWCIVAVINMFKKKSEKIVFWIGAELEFPKPEVCRQVYQKTEGVIFLYDPPEEFSLVMIKKFGETALQSSLRLYHLVRAHLLTLAF